MEITVYLMKFSWLLECSVGRMLFVSVKRLTHCLFATKTGVNSWGFRQKEKWSVPGELARERRYPRGISPVHLAIPEPVCVFARITGQ